jgi:hypothetical protein
MNSNHTRKERGEDRNRENPNQAIAYTFKFTSTHTFCIENNKKENLT